MSSKFQFPWRFLCGAGLATVCVGCGRRAVTPTELAPNLVVEAPPAPTPHSEPPQAADSDELRPGALRAFGVALPEGTRERFSSDSTKMYIVPAPMNKVMEYLQRRIDITTGDIRPLGALIHNARVRVASEGAPLNLDIGVRDEGERTFLTLRSAPILPSTLEPGQTMTREEALRAAGIDPATGRPLPSQNH